MQTDQFWERALMISEGSMSPTIKWKTLAQQEFIIPPKDEQRRIADILWAADKAILKYEDLLTGIKLDKRILIKEAYLSSKITFTALGNYSGLVTSGSRGWAQYYASEGSVFVRVTNLTREIAEIDVRDLEFVQLPQETEGTRTRVAAGDILISITADLGRVAVVPPDFPEAYVNQHVALVRLQPDIQDPYFIAYYLLSPEGQKQFLAFNDAGTKAGMNLQNVRRLRIPYADPDHQKRFVRLFRNLDSQISQIQEHSIKLVQLKRNLLLLLSSDSNLRCTF
jgi:type I restriction enzyme S subunit